MTGVEIAGVVAGVLVKAHDIISSLSKAIASYKKETSAAKLLNLDLILGNYLRLLDFCISVTKTTNFPTELPAILGDTISHATALSTLLDEEKKKGKFEKWIASFEERSQKVINELRETYSAFMKTLHTVQDVPPWIKIYYTSASASSFCRTHYPTTTTQLTPEEFLNALIQTFPSGVSTTATTHTTTTGETNTTESNLLFGVPQKNVLYCLRYEVTAKPEHKHITIGSLIAFLVNAASAEKKLMDGGRDMEDVLTHRLKKVKPKFGGKAKNFYEAGKFAFLSLGGLNDMAAKIAALKEAREHLLAYELLVEEGDPEVQDPKEDRYLEYLMRIEDQLEQLSQGSFSSGNAWQRWPEWQQKYGTKSWEVYEKERHAFKEKLLQDVKVQHGRESSPPKTETVLPSGDSPSGSQPHQGEGSKHAPHPPASPRPGKTPEKTSTSK